MAQVQTITVSVKDLGSFERLMGSVKRVLEMVGGDDCHESHCPYFTTHRPRPPCGCIYGAIRDEFDQYRRTTEAA